MWDSMNCFDIVTSPQRGKEREGWGLILDEYGGKGKGAGGGFLRRCKRQGKRNNILIEVGLIKYATITTFYFVSVSIKPFCCSKGRKSGNCIGLTQLRGESRRGGMPVMRVSSCQRTHFL